jgi:hypothetical protein
VNFNTGEVIAENISLPINETKLNIDKVINTSNVPEAFWDLLNRR